MSIVDWAELSTTHIASQVDDRTLAVVPIAATEQHGPHLPLGTDSIILAGLLDRLRERHLGGGRALLLPLQPIGFSPEHKSFPGTLSLSAETLLAVWYDLARSVASTGVRRLLFLNSHGGNGALAQVATMRLRDELSLLAAVLTTHALGGPEGMLEAEERRFGIHAGHAETALMRALTPDLVREAQSDRFTSREGELATERIGFTGGHVRVAWRSEDLHPAGAVGDASRAKQDDGNALLAFLTDRVVEAFEAMLAWPLPEEAPRRG